MGNTLEDHRAVIGRFAARQVSYNCKPSSISRSFKMTGKKRKKPHVAKADRTCVGRGIHLILMFSLLATAYPGGQRSDPGSFYMTGYGNSKDLNMTTFKSWNHQLTELPTMPTKLNNAAVEAITTWSGYQASFNLLTSNQMIPSQMEVKHHQHSYDVFKC